MLWDFIGSLGMQGCEAMRLPMGSQGTALPPDMWGQSQPWESLSGIFGVRSIAGWGTSTRDDGGILLTPNNRLGS
jgi:hypothetical protein